MAIISYADIHDNVGLTLITPTVLLHHAVPIGVSTTSPATRP
jgi:hypothetical protein